MSSFLWISVVVKCGGIIVIPRKVLQYSFAMHSNLCMRKSCIVRMRLRIVHTYSFNFFFPATGSLFFGPTVREI